MVDVNVSVLRRKTTLSQGGREVFSFDAKLSEQATDSITKTSHPVESGSETTDHATIKPVKLTLSIAVSGSPTGGADQGVSNRQLVAYQRLRDLLYTREPVTVQTGVRQYQNMLLISIGHTHDRSAGNNFRATVEFEEIQIATQILVPVPQEALGTKAKRSGASKKDKGDQPAKEKGDDTAEKKKADESMNKPAGGEPRSAASKLYGDGVFGEYL